MRSDPQNLYRAFAAALAVVALAFVGATALTDRTLGQIDADVRNLTVNSLPSIHHLAGARTELQHVTAELRNTVEDPEPGRRTEHAERLQQALAGFDSELSQYGATQWYPDERAVFATELSPARARLQQEIARVVSLENPRPSLVALEKEVTAATDAVDASIRMLFRANHDESNRSIARIAETRARSARISIVLDALAAVVTAIAAWLTMNAARRFERVLRHNAELNAARVTELDAFAGRVAHDLLGPLAAVTFTLELIGHHHDDPTIRDHVARANRSILRSRDMVNGILQFARSGGTAATDAHVSLGTAVRSAVDEVLAAEAASPPDVTIESFEDCEVSCEPAAVNAILANLLSNACKYTRSSPTRCIVIRVERLLERIRIEIEDTGPGVPADMEEKLFEPYVRVLGTQQSGLGLGLATVKRFAVAHGGRVGVRRGRLGGSVFWVDLPRAARRANAPALEHAAAVTAP